MSLDPSVSLSPVILCRKSNVNIDQISILGKKHVIVSTEKIAKDLFSDYLRVQGNVMSKDQKGNSLFAGLMDRKQRLEGTEQQAKSLDGELRNRFGIAPYRF